ncbi:MAG: hypothetical protein JJU45_17090 [Acidimicrobiia bacterium]|nr:hypothetical protein [Acidimicrobiia bacterium]
MPADPSGDLGVDVLIIGDTVQAAYLAASLHPRWSVCVLDDPSLGAETLLDEGYLSAGYEGNDPNRMQPARRAMGFWDHWLRTHDLHQPDEEAWCVVSPTEQTRRTNWWRDAGLPFAVGDALPDVMSGGVLARFGGYRLAMDRVGDPATLLETLRKPVERRYVRGRLMRFAMFDDTAIDSVEIEVDGQPVRVVARFVVACADAGNAEVLRQLSVRFGDAGRRRSAATAVAECQAVQQLQVVAVHGDLPLVSGWFDRLHVVAHPWRGRTLWLVRPPADHHRTVAGPVDLRFEPTLDPVLVAATVERLLDIAPDVGAKVDDLRWAAWARRRTQHPMLADARAAQNAEVGTPVPAKLETLGLDCFAALWPSHLAYTMILGDVMAERIATALGEPDDHSDLAGPEDLAGLSTRAPVPAWASSEVDWSDWRAFADRFGVSVDR